VLTLFSNGISRTQKTQKSCKIPATSLQNKMFNQTVLIRLLLKALLQGRRLQILESKGPKHIILNYVFKVLKN
jgi:hypothetical protein